MSPCAPPASRRALLGRLELARPRVGPRSPSQRTPHAADPTRGRRWSTADAPRSPATGSVGELDVSIVGAGPTGLTLAARLRSFGTRAGCDGCSGRHDHSLARRIAAVRWCSRGRCSRGRRGFREGVAPASGCPTPGCGESGVRCSSTGSSPRCGVTCCAAASPSALWGRRCVVCRAGGRARRAVRAFAQRPSPNAGARSGCVP